MFKNHFPHSWQTHFDLQIFSLSFQVYDIQINTDYFKSFLPKTPTQLLILLKMFPLPTTWPILSLEKWLTNWSFSQSSSGRRTLCTRAISVSCKIDRLNQKILHFNIERGISGFKLWKLLMQENKIVVRKYWKKTKEGKLGYHNDNGYPKKRVIYRTSMSYPIFLKN